MALRSSGLVREMSQEESEWGNSCRSWVRRDKLSFQRGPVRAHQLSCSSAGQTRRKRSPVLCPPASCQLAASGDGEVLPNILLPAQDTVRGLRASPQGIYLCAQPACPRLVTCGTPSLSQQSLAHRVGLRAWNNQEGPAGVWTVAGRNLCLHPREPQFLYLLSEDEHKDTLLVWHWPSPRPDINITAGPASHQDLGRLVWKVVGEIKQGSEMSEHSLGVTQPANRERQFSPSINCYQDGCCESHMTQHWATIRIMIAIGANTNFLHARFLLPSDLIFLEPCN